MRSFLFVPADGGRQARQGDGERRRRRDPRSRGFDRARAQRSRRAKPRSDFLKAAQGKKDRPRLLVRINGLDTGMTDADLDAIVAGAPDAILFPKAEGGATRHPSRRQADRARGHRRPARRLDQDSGADGGVGRRACSPPAPIRNSSARLIGMTWGPEDLSSELGAEANRDADGTLTEPYRLARSMCLFGAAAAKVPAIETIHVDFRNLDALRRDTEDCAPRRLCRAARHPSGAGAGDQRGVHAERRADRKGQGRDRRLRGASPAPAPSASTARCTTARIWRAQALGVAARRARTDRLSAKRSACAE